MFFDDMLHVFDLFLGLAIDRYHLEYFGMVVVGVVVFIKGNIVVFVSILAVDP
jgi:hypothetical protein